ncbi:MAG: F0F1 ATP synthase subunit B [Planctomycetes bacterium]|nr:F0F1 ATP synthase subunit B [Planctomycetota bacterium]
MRGWLVLLVLPLVFLALSPAPAWAKKDTPAESKKGAGKEKEEAHKEEGVFKGALDLTIYSIIIFLGLLFILTRYAWKPMLQGLETRERDIAAAVEEAKKAKDEAAHLRATMQQEIAKGHDEVRELIARARADADRLKQQRETEAEAVISAERERFEREKATARDQALHDLWSQAAELAALVSSKVIRRQLTAEDHRALVDEALKELPQAAAHRHQGDGRAT